MNKRLTGLLLLFCVLLAFSSCTSYRRMIYMHDLENVKQATLLSSPQDKSEHKIEVNDVISIRITSPTTEDKAWQMFNNSVAGANAATAPSPLSGYLVNADGHIEIPLLDPIKAEGLTKSQLKETITKQILDKRLLIDPNVEVRYLNYEVTVIGEVARPMVINVPSEKISLLKALGTAGDITPYGRKDNVVLIRENEGKKTFTRLNLMSSTFLQSPYYYLQPNDVVYVETTSNRAASVDKTRLFISAIASAVSVIVLVLDRVIR